MYLPTPAISDYNSPSLGQGAIYLVNTEYNVSRLAQLTPRMQKLIKTQTANLKEIARLRKKFKKLKAMTPNDVVDLKLFKNLPPALKSMYIKVYTTMY